MHWARMYDSRKGSQIVDGAESGLYQELGGMGSGIEGDFI